MADLNTSQRLTQENGQPVEIERQDVVIDRIWNRVKNYCVWIAGILLLFFAFQGGCTYGKRNPDCNSDCQQTSASSSKQTGQLKAGSDQTKTELNINTAVAERFGLVTEKLEKLTERVFEKTEKNNENTPSITIRKNGVTSPSFPSQIQTTLNIKDPLKVELVKPASTEKEDKIVSPETSQEKCEREAMEQRKARDCTNH